MFETYYQEDMVEDKAVQLVKDAIRAGIFNDLGSGSNVDITVIRRDGTVSRHRTFEDAAGQASAYRAKFARPAKLTPPPGTTFVIEETYRAFKKDGKKSEEAAAAVAAAAMEI